MNIQRHNPATFTLTIPCQAHQKQSMMLASDIHFDSSHCDIKRFTEHLKLANDEKAPVLIAGDFFDAMQGHDDPRRSPEELKAEYKVSHYFDAIVLDASHYLQQFKDVPLWLFGMGNHESSVMRKINTNLLERLAYDMRLHGQTAEAAGYWGYLRIMMDYTKGGDKLSKNLYWHHGVSSGAPVTKGVIQVNRQGVYLHDADIVLNGHNHQSYWMPVQVERVSKKTMDVYTESVHYFRTPGYKMSPSDSGSVVGYGAEKHRAPTPKGCVFLDFEYHKGSPLQLEHRIKIA